MIKKLKQIYEDIEKPLTIVNYSHLRDGGSETFTFSDGFSCMFDNGINSKTKFNFVKSWKDRTVINLDKKYKDVLMSDNRFEHEHYL